MTSTEDLGHQITRCIADAVTDVLAHVASYCGEQVAATAHEDARGPLLCAGCLAELQPGQDCTCAWADAMRIKLEAHLQPTGIIRCEGDAAEAVIKLRARNQQLEQLASGMLLHFTAAGKDGDAVIVQVSRKTIDRWQAILDGTAEPSMLRPETEMWRDLVGDVGIDQANRDWPKLDPRRGGPGYTRKS